MKAEFREGIAYLERWYDWRDKQTDTRYEEVYNSGWIPNTLCPDELRTYKKYEHGQMSGDYILVFCQDIHRYDLFQLEDAMRGNGECLWATAQHTCFCYSWPGAIYSMEWTDEDEKTWLAGGLYPQTESALKDQKTWRHLKNKYGYDAYFDEIPNDVVLVIEEGDNATQEEVRSGTPATDAKRLVDSAEAMGEDAAYRELAEALQAFSASAGRVVERVGLGLRQHFPLDESGNGT